MSCKNKSGNFPGTSTLDKVFKSLSPSNIAASASALEGKIATQLKNAVNDQNGSIAGIKNLFSGSSKDFKLGIGEDLSKIGPNTLKAINKAKSDIADQYNKAKSLFACEEDTTQSAHDTNTQANSIQNAANQSSVADIKNLSNKDIKTLSESPDAQSARASSIATTATATAASTASTQNTNAAVATTQSNSVKTLETTPVSTKQKLETSTEYAKYITQDKLIASAVTSSNSTNQWTSGDNKSSSIRTVANSFNVKVARPIASILKLYQSDQLTYSDSIFNINYYTVIGRTFVAQIQYINGQLTSAAKNTELGAADTELNKLDQVAIDGNIKLIK